MKRKFLHINDQSSEGNKINANTKDKLIQISLLYSNQKCIDTSQPSNESNTSQSNIEKISNKPIKIILDLDCTIISEICSIEDKSGIKVINKIKDIIGNDSIIESVGYYFYLYNGWKEFIKYVMKLTNNELIFFSSSPKERNEDIIPKMLTRVLGYDSKDYFMNHVKILSRQDTIDTSYMLREEADLYQPEGMYGQRKKDLSVAVEQSSLSHAMLIDDDESYVIKGQEKNLLRINGQSISYTLSRILEFNSADVDELEQLEEFGSKFHSVNKLFYATGVLNDVLSKYAIEDDNLIDILWKHHGYVPDDSRNLLLRYNMYQLGLETLRVFNNELRFLTAGKY